MTKHLTLRLLLFLLALPTAQIYSFQCTQTKHKRSAQTVAISASSSSASTETTNSTSSCNLSVSLSMLEVELSALIAKLLAEHRAKLKEEALEASISHTPIDQNNAKLKNEALQASTPLTPIPLSTMKRESTYGALLPDGKHFMLSSGKRIRVMRFEGKTWKCVDEFTINPAKIHGITVLICVDGKLVPLDTSNEKHVAKDWHNCILVTNDWSNTLKTTDLKKVYKDLTILKTLEKNTAVRCYRIPTQGSESGFTFEQLQ